MWRPPDPLDAVVVWRDQAEQSAGTITVVIRCVVPGVQAWRACSMLIAAEIQRSLTGNRQAWSSAERELMPH
jgi:hypothetical protein